MDIQNTVHVNSAFTYAQKKAISYRHEFITPEHLLSAFLEQSPFANALNMCFCDAQELAFSLENYFTEELESVPADMDVRPDAEPEQERHVDKRSGSVQALSG